MGECPDYSIGERVLVLYELDRVQTTVGIDGAITWLWETHVDVRSGDHVLRMPRGSIDCGGQDVGGKTIALASMADEAIPVGSYEPQDEASEGWT